MAVYPDLRQGIDSSESRIGGRTVDRASNGSVKVRSFFTSEKKAFKVLHNFMTPAQKAQIEAFYVANQNISFTFVWIPDGATYTCIFDETNPTYNVTHGGYWNIEVFLLQL